jgi:dipeptidyl aminopeptidase/acylaminoacyl peptidase
MKRTLLTRCVFIALAFLPAKAQYNVAEPRYDPSLIRIPEVKSSIPRPVTNMDLLTIRDIHGVTIAPDGKYVAFIVGQAVYETNSYRTGLFVASTETASAPLNLGSVGPARWSYGGEWMDEPPRWSPDSRYIICRANLNGRWQLWRWSREGGKTLQLTHTEHNVWSYEWLPNGRDILFTIGKSIAAEEATALGEHGIRYDGRIFPWQGRPIVEQELERIPAQTEDWVYDTVTGQERRATAADRPEDWKKTLGDTVYDRTEALSGAVGKIQDPKLSPDGTKAVFRVYLDDATQSEYSSFALYVKSLRGGPAITLRRARYFPAYQWSKDGSEIYFTEYQTDGRSPKLYVVSPTGGVPRLLSPNVGSDFLDHFSLNDDATVAACTIERNTAPADAAILNLRTGAVRTLTKLNPEFQNLELSPPIRIEWKNKFGDAGHAYFLKPLNYEQGKRYPLVVTTYRSGDYFLRGGVGDEYPIQVFAANGFAVLAFDYGESRNVRPGDFEVAKLRWTSPVAGLEAALKVVDDMGVVDLKRTGLTGLSYGSEIVDFTISHSHLFKAAVASGGGSRDPLFYYMADSRWHRQFADWGLAGWPEGKSSKNWHEISPALNAEKVQAPLLVNAADTEYAYGLQFYTTLEQLGKPVELFIYPNELHIKSQPKHRYEIYEKNVDWFRFWLQGWEGPDPAKREQYERWHKFRDLDKTAQAER